MCALGALSLPSATELKIDEKMSHEDWEQLFGEIDADDTKYVVSQLKEFKAELEQARRNREKATSIPATSNVKPRQETVKEFVREVERIEDHLRKHPKAPAAQTAGCNSRSKAPRGSGLFQNCAESWKRCVTKSVARSFKECTESRACCMRGEPEGCALCKDVSTDKKVAKSNVHPEVVSSSTLSNAVEDIQMSSPSGGSGSSMTIVIVGCSVGVLVLATVGVVVGMAVHRVMWLRKQRKQKCDKDDPHESDRRTGAREVKL
jgi:hypothetical protein